MSRPGAAGPPWRTVVQAVAGVALLGVVVLWPAGTLGWPRGWAYLGLVTANFAVNYLLLSRFNPELIERRSRLGPGTKRWDVVWSVLFGPLFVSIYVVAGFDAERYQWTTMSPWLWPVGLLVFLPGTVLFTWSMCVNPFFEKTVRIQTDRGQYVVDTGPYRYVRHPGYAGFLGWSLSAPLLLGSWWAFVPAAMAVAGIAIRTALEDTTLRRELGGYPEYAARVRFRLIPGIW
jgi:protein-S-isoprenylcysteine O-methyltransferase Ste14